MAPAGQNLSSSASDWSGVLAKVDLPSEDEPAEPTVTVKLVTVISDSQWTADGGDPNTSTPFRFPGPQPDSCSRLNLTALRIKATKPDGSHTVKWPVNAILVREMLPNDFNLIKEA